MAEPQMVDPHDVVMTGENSFIRLSNDGGKTIDERVSHWRVLWSPAGQGHALFVESSLTGKGPRVYADNPGVARYLQGPELTRTLLSRGLEVAVSILVITFLFALLFRYVPDAAIHWRDVWLGGFVSAMLFTVGKVGIGYYIGRASVGSAYGAAGSLMVLLVWVYYSSLIVFFGAEFTHAWATRQGAVAPQPHAVAGAAPQTKGEMAAERTPGA